MKTHELYYIQVSLDCVGEWSWQDKILLGDLLTITGLKELPQNHTEIISALVDCDFLLEIANDILEITYHEGYDYIIISEKDTHKPMFVIYPNCEN